MKNTYMPKTVINLDCVHRPCDVMHFGQIPNKNVCCNNRLDVARVEVLKSYKSMVT